MSDNFDLLIIGGGINGTAIARDASGRGLSVCLCEKDDLASHTSSASTKLIHGGLRYLEHYEFRLVRDSLKEREVLLRAAPHIIWPMRFVLPYDKGLRPKWMLRAGLFLYDSLGGREILPGTKTVDLTKSPHKGILEARLTTGFEYSDCWVEDARLVVLNAVDAALKGGDVRTRTAVTDIRSVDGGYEADIKDETGGHATLRAKAVVNAAGPWVEDVLLKMKRGRNSSALRLVKGSHIVTRKLFEGDHAYIFQNADDRVIFAIPYEREYTLIGTTDVPYTDDAQRVEASAEEISYLCSAANEYLEADITPEDVVWTYSGVRPLYDDKSADASEVTRDYVLNLDEFEEGCPFVSVYGGKITTSRKLAEHVMEKLDPFFESIGKKWTRAAHLPGGDIEDADFERFYAELSLEYSGVDDAVVHRLCRGYGTRARVILGDAKVTEDLGRNFGAGLTESEVRYQHTEEWVRSSDDTMWRRSKLGLHMTEHERKAFSEWYKSAFSNI